MPPAPIQRRWRSLFVLAFGNAIDNADGNVMTVLGTYIMKALSMDLLALGWIHAIGRLSRMIFGPLWALAGDRFDRRWLMFVVTGVWGVWTFLAGTVQNSTQFFIFYSIAVIGTVATEPLTVSITSDLFPEAERGQAFGVLRSVGNVVLILFVPLALFFTHYDDGWRWILFSLGGLSTVSGILTLVFLKDPGRGASEDQAPADGRIRRGDFRFLTSTSSFWIMALSLVLLTSTIGTQFYVVFFHSQHIGQGKANLILGVYLVAYAVSLLLGGALGDWTHRRWGIGGRIGLMQIYLLAFAGMSALCLLINWPVWAYFPLFFVFGLLSGIGTPACILPVISSVVLPETRSTAFGVLLSFCQGASMTILSVVFPLVEQHFGWDNAFFWILTVPYLVNAVVWFGFYKAVPRDHRRIEEELKRRAAEVP
jgi:MFS family permease